MSISTVTSEALQAKLRQILPSQQGFGTDLSASDTIIPIIDLTEAAEGSSVGVSLQQALAFGSQTSFAAAGSTDVIANTPGFYRIFGNSSQRSSIGGTTNSCSLTMTDGASIKTIWSQKIPPISSGSSPEQFINVNFDVIVFLGTGDSISAVSSNGNSHIIGSSRQIADANGVLVNPVGFTPQ